MNAKSWAMGILFVLGCVILAIGWENFGAAQIQAPVPSAAGRYQFSLKAMDASNTVVFVFDSTTGRCWYRDTATPASGGAGWTELGSPMEKK
jgi:hypothetical protein